MEETNNNSTIPKDTLKHDEKENMIASLSDEDSLTKPKKKCNHYVRKNPEEDKRRTKERTPKQLEALKKGRLKVQQRVMKKKEEEIQKYLAEIALTKSKQNLDYNTAKKHDKKETVLTSSSDESDEEENVLASSSEEEIIIKSKKKKLKKQKKKKKIIYLSDSSDSDSGSDDDYVIEQPKRSRVNRQQLQNEIKQELPKIDYRSFFC